MDEALDTPLPTQVNDFQPTWRFYPSHLTKGLVGLVLSTAFAIYAGHEFQQVGKDVYPVPKS